MSHIDALLLSPALAQATTGIAREIERRGISFARILQAVTEMVATYAHAVDERRLSELEAAFQTHPQTQAAKIALGGAS